MSFVAHKTLLASEGCDQSMRTLVIGDLPRWAAEGRDISSSDDLSYLSLDELNRERLDQIDPDIVLSPLVGGSFDAVDVAAALAQAAFAGRYRAVSHQTTDKALIMAEIAFIAPDLDFDLLEIK